MPFLDIDNEESKKVTEIERLNIKLYQERSEMYQEAMLSAFSTGVGLFCIIDAVKRNDLMFYGVGGVSFWVGINHSKYVIDSLKEQKKIKNRIKTIEKEAK